MLVPTKEIIAAVEKRKEEAFAHVQRLQAWQSAGSIGMESIQAKLEDSMSGGMISAMRRKYTEAKLQGDKAQQAKIAKNLMGRTNALLTSPAYQTAVTTALTQAQRRQETLGDSFEHATFVRDELSVLHDNLLTAKKMRVTTIDCEHHPEQMPAEEMCSSLQESVFALISEEKEGNTPSRGDSYEM